MIGCGIGLGFPRNAAGSAFDPLSLSPTGWWRADYAGSPWADESGNGRTLTEATNPPSSGDSARASSQTGAIFDGVNDTLATSAAASSFMAVNAFSGWAVINVDGLDATTGGWTGDTGIINTSGTGQFGVYAYTGKVGVAVYDGANKTVETTLAHGKLQLVQWRHNGTTLEIRVNDGAWATVAAGSVSSLAAVLDVGRNPGFTKFFGGRIYEIGLCNTRLSDDAFDDLWTYADDTYGISAWSEFDIATLPLTLLLDGAFRGSPWNGAPSAGSSGNRQMLEATNPPARGAFGSTLNWYAPADCDGTNDILANAGGGVTTDTLFNANAGSIAVLFNADTAAAPGATGTNACLIMDYSSAVLSAYVGIEFTTSGLTFYIWDGSYKTRTIACATGGWHLAQMKWNGSTLFARLDNGAWQSVACGSISSVTNTIRLMTNLKGSKSFDGKYMFIATSDTVLSDAAFDNIRARCNSRFAVSV